jgi:hypothetical protein
MAPKENQFNIALKKIKKSEKENEIANRDKIK